MIGWCSSVQNAFLDDYRDQIMCKWITGWKSKISWSTVDVDQEGSPNSISTIPFQYTHDPVLRLLLNDCKLMRNLTTSKVHFLVNKFGTFYKKKSQILLYASIQELKRCFWSVHLKKKMWNILSRQFELSKI